jgi:hypothetical protein
MPRQNFAPTENLAVCIKHYEADCILTSYCYKYKLGNMKTFSYDRPKLKPGSCPGLPKYLNIVTAPKRKSPESRRTEILERQTESQELIEQAKLKADTIF